MEELKKIGASLLAGIAIGAGGATALNHSTPPATQQPKFDPATFTAAAPAVPPNSTGSTTAQKQIYRCNIDHSKNRPPYCRNLGL